MILSRECVRDLLLTVESSGFNETLWLKEVCANSKMKFYSEETVLYTIQKLFEANFIDGNILYAEGKAHSVGIDSLTWEGHQFLDNIRDPGVWEAVKSKTSKLTSVSLPILSDLAVSFVKGQIGLS